MARVLAALLLGGATGCTGPVPSPPPDPTASPTPTAIFAVAIGAGLIDCGPNFGGCYVRILVWSGPDHRDEPLDTVDLPMDPAGVNRFLARSVAVPLVVRNAGRHAVQVQIAYGSDVGTPVPLDSRSWMPLCAGVVEFAADPPWRIPIRFEGADGCTIVAQPA